MWELTDHNHPEHAGPRFYHLADASRVLERSSPPGRFFLRWIGKGDAPREGTTVPMMGWQSCRYVFDGTDAEDGDYYRCLVHGYLTLGDQISCEGAEHHA